MHPLDSTFLKFRRAKEHFKVADEIIKGLRNRNIYRFATEIVGKGNTREYLVRFKQTEPLPTDLHLAIGDCCNNLRSALDHLLWQLHVLQKPSFSRNVKFPIWDNERLFESNALRDISGLSDAQWVTIESLQPYRTGNNALSILRDVNDSDKHRLIQIIGIQGQFERIRIAFNQSKSMVIVPPIKPIIKKIPTGTEIKDNAIIARVPLKGVSQGTQMQVHSFLDIDLAFTGGKLVEPCLVTRSLIMMVGEVSHSISLLESEFKGTSTFKV